MSNLAPQLDFKVGLVGVTVQQEADSPSSLPSPQALGPGSPHFELQLEEVLYDPASLEHRLLAELQPQITHRDILRPWVFHAMINQVLEWLRGRTRDAEPSEDRGKLDQAASTLQEFGSLVTLFRRYQHALHRG